MSATPFNFDTVTPDLLMATTKKLIDINKGQADPDDRDSLANQKFMGPEDFFAERIDKDSGGIGKKILWKSTGRGKLVGVSSGALSPQLDSVLLNSGLGTALEEINPIEILDQHTRVLRLGDGGIPSVQSIPEEAKGVQASQFGFIDPIRGPESSKLGVDSRITLGSFKGDDGNLYSNFIDTRTGEPRVVSARDASALTIAFPGEMQKKSPTVRAMHKGKLSYVPKTLVDLELPHASEMFSATSNLVPMPNTAQGNRLFMAGKMISQALPLENAEAPLVQSALSEDGVSFMEAAGSKMGTIRSEQPGIVSKITPDEIIVKQADGSKKSYELYNNFPLNRKTQLRSISKVQVGDRIKGGDLLAYSNFTDPDGTTAIGKNLRVGFFPFAGLSVSGDTNIFWRDERGIGKYTPIRDIAHRGKIYANALDDTDWEAKIHPVKAYIAHEASVPMCKVTTLDGDEVTTTESHSFVTMGDDGRLIPIYPEDMVIGRTVVPVVPLQGVFSGKYTRVSNKPKTNHKTAKAVDLPLDRDIGFLYGMYISEGWTGGSKHQHKNIGIAVVEPELIAKLTEICIKHDLSHTIKICKKENGTSGVFIIYSAALASLIAKGCGNGCANKKIPAEAWASNREFVEGLISGYWCGDGTISDKQMTASTASRQLANGLCALLSALGVRATYRTYQPKQGNFKKKVKETNHIKIFAHSLRSMPKLDLSRKQEKLETLINKGEKFTRDRIPVPKKFIPAVNKALSGRNVVPPCGYIGRPLLKEIEHKLPKEIITIINADVWWDVVANIDEAQEESVVFDLDMQPISNFSVGSGLTVHNTFEDAYVISESAAKKMSSEHMYAHSLDTNNTKHVDKNKYITMFSGKYDKDQLKKIGDDGIILEGSKVEKGDPLILATGEAEARADGQWKNLSTKASRGFRDRSETWDHDSTGVITDVMQTPSGVKVAVSSVIPMKKADKLSAFFGDKGIVAKVIPDDQMPKDAQGRPFEVIQNPLTLPTRMNPAQIYEMQLSKIARKLGRPIKVPQFKDEDMADWVGKQLKLHGLSDTEDIYDPVKERTIKSVLTGEKYFMKLHHTAESKSGARDVSGYTSEGAPSSGGKEGSKTIANLGLNSLLAHGAVNFIRDTKTVRSQQNDDFWRAYKLGYAPPTPKESNTYKKYLAYLQGAGIKVDSKPNQLNIMAMTDKDIDNISRGAITKATTVNAKDLSPKAGGLFDRAITGAHGGDKFSHINLNEPMPNPVMEEPIRRLLGLRKKDITEVIAGRMPLAGKTGGAAIKEALSRLNIDKLIPIVEEDIKGSRGSIRDNSIKRLRYLKMMKDTGIKPADLVLSKFLVIPPKFRPISKMENGVQLASDPNYLYQDLILHNDVLNDVRDEFGDEEAGDEKVNLYNSLKATAGLADPVPQKLQDQQVKGLLKHVFGKASPKLGLFQKRVIGMSTDLSARGVISPNPKLNMDEVGLPETQAWKIFSPFVIRNMVRRGMGASQAAEALKTKSKEARAALEAVMEERPIVITRAPVLSKYGMMGVKAKLIDGESLEMSPVIAKSFTADYDGDAMSYHVPVSDSSVKDVMDKMLPSKNLLHSRDFGAHYVPTQEYAYGLYLASGKSSGKKQVFENKEAAIKAYRRGEVGINDEVEILR